jgi:hypothetical protein
VWHGEAFHGLEVQGLGVCFFFLEIEIILFLLSAPNEIELETNNRKIDETSLNSYRLNNTFLRNTWLKKKSQ